MDIVESKVRSWAGSGSPRPVFVTFTARGAVLASRLAEELDGEWHATPRAVVDTETSKEPVAVIDIVADHIRDLFLAGRPVVGICAAAILIRSIAGHAVSKHSDAPVVAVSEDGAVVVPLIGGHHGANRLAEVIATRTGGTAAITTAGDRAHGVALDEPPKGIVLARESEEVAKTLMAQFLGGGKTRLTDDLPATLADLADAWRTWLQPVTAAEGEKALSTLHLTLKPAGGTHIPQDSRADGVFHPQCVCIGLGASRDCPEAEMLALVEKGLAEAGVAPEALSGVYSVDLKADEGAILAVALRLGHRLRVFTPERLEGETPRLTEPSEVVKREVGSHGVAEAAALAAAGPDGALLLPKIKDAHSTMALALRVDPASGDEGRHPGCVMLVGIGPGRSDWRTPEATSMIAAADELVGYGFYIDLLGGLACGKSRRDFALGEEEDRCRYALEEAAKGRDIALICSGDAGIYAMGALVYELLEREPDEGGVGDTARRVEVVTAPGVSALQAAAARSGAILGHDFCAISLSDLLTPWEVIERRVRAAAEGDFVVAFYNPVSSKRRTGMEKAKAILLEHRKADTPVVIATNLGRQEESIRHRYLGGLEIDEIDMMTVVMVGSSTSRRVEKHGEEIVFTPRGYAKHLDRKQERAKA